MTKRLQTEQPCRDLVPTRAVLVHQPSFRSRFPASSWSRCSSSTRSP